MDNRQDNRDIREKSALFVDALTNLPNRYFLFNLFPRFLEEAKTQGSGLCIFMLDIDNFKYINDTYGHLRGDSVLREVAGLLRECVRANDTVIRYAGDEFIVLSRIAEEGQIRHISQRILERIGKNIFKGKPTEPDISFTISGGFAIYPRDDENLEELIDDADKALYFSKERGKNRISDFSEVALGDITYKETLKALTCPGFVDRLSQIKRLKETWKEIFSFQVSFALVKGKAGAGKSRLLDEFQNYLKSERAVTLKIACLEQHTQEPYYALAKVIGEYLEKAQKEAGGFGALFPEEESRALAKLIPQLKIFAGKEGLSKEEPAPAPEDLSLQVFKGLRNILVKLSGQNGLFLYFDNLQWLDKATLELLNYFLGTEMKRRIMFAATFTEDEAYAEGLPCQDFLSGVKGNFVFLDAGFFSLEESREFITTIFPNINAPLEFFQSIHKITQGNCLFMQEVLRCLVEDNKILYKNNQWQLPEPGHVDIPSSMGEVIQRRLRKIDPEIKEVLAQAAVMGGSLQLEVLRQIVKKDQGRLFELIDHAREKGVLSFAQKTDEINFMSDYIQKAIYNEVGSDEKVDLHRKAAEVLRDVNKDNLQQVIGDLIYHSQESGDEGNLNEYKNALSRLSLSLFNPQEVATYLEELGALIAQEPAPSALGIEKIETEISEEILAKVADLSKAVFVALGNISLYPAVNKTRQDSITKVYTQILEMLENIPSLTFTEVERILLVNGKRMPYRQEKTAVIDSFIGLMREKDIKAIQFLKQIEEREVEKLLVLLAEEPDNLRKRGGLAKALAQEKVSHLKIELLDYERLAVQKAGRPVKERITNAALLDFLLSKSPGEKPDTNRFANQLKNAPEVLAKDLTEAARLMSAKSAAEPTDLKPQAELMAESIRELGMRLLPGGWQAYKENLAKLFSSLDKPLQSNLVSLAVDSKEPGMKVIQEMIGSLSDAEIAEVICSGYAPGKDAFLYMKDLFSKIVEFQPERKEKLMPLVEDKLKGIGLGQAEVSFVTQKDYRQLSFDEKKEMLFKLPAYLYPSIGRDNIRGLIEELLCLRDYDALRKIMAYLLEQLGKSPVETKEMLYELVGDFISLLGSASSKFDEIIFEIFSALEKRMDEEEDAVYSLLLKDLEAAINWVAPALSVSSWSERRMVYRRLAWLNSLISRLFNKLEAKGESAESRKQKGLIQELILRLSHSKLIELLIQQLKKSSLSNPLIEEVVLKFGASCVDKLTTLVIENMDFSLEGYIYRKKISSILEKIGKPAVDKLKDLILHETESQNLRLWVEVAGYIKNAELVEALLPLVKHKDVQVRREIVVALSRIADAQSEEGRLRKRN